MNKISAKLKLIIFKYSELVFILTFWHSKQPHKEITYNNSRLQQMAVRFKEFFFFYWGGGCPKNFKFLKDPWKKLYFLN